MLEWQTSELKALGRAVDTALLAEGMPIGQASDDEPESELPSSEEVLEVGLSEVQREVLLGFVSSPSHVSEGEDPAARRLRTAMGELLTLLQKTVRLAQVRGQRAQHLEEDLASARAAARGATAGNEPPPQPQASQQVPHQMPQQADATPAAAAESPKSACDEKHNDAADAAESAAVRLTAARKTIKEKEWELVEARTRVEQLERERARQDQRLRQLETVAQRAAWLRDGGGSDGPCGDSSRPGADDSPKHGSPAKCYANAPAREPCLVQDEIANIEQNIEKRRIRFAVDDQAGTRLASARDGISDTNSRSQDSALTADAKPLRHGDSAIDIGQATQEPLVKTYLVDNSLVNSTTKGLSYRLSKELQNRDGNNLALWGTFVRGTDEDDGWVRIGDRYLPRRVGGVAVLSIQDSANQSSDGMPGTVGNDHDGHQRSSRKSTGGITVAVPHLVGLSTTAPASADDVHRPRLAAPATDGKQSGTHSLPMDLRGLGKLLSGHAIKTPRR